MEHLLGVILVQQYNLKKGLELFGDRAEVATTKELQQIHDFGTYVPQEAKSLSRAERTKALSALMFIWRREMETSRRENAQWEASNGHFQARSSRNGFLPPYQQMVSLSLPQMR